MTLPRVAILGGGPAGVGAALRLRRLGKAAVTLLEQQPVLGGNAGSFAWRDQRLDFGSHRLHPACEPHILEDIRGLLGDDLLDRPRHGRIRLRGRWIHFPLKPADLIRRLPPGFALGSALDAVRKIAVRRVPGDSFAEVLQANLGQTICRDFYFPYARKIWGRDATELSGNQARRRVSANSFFKLMRKVASQIPGLKPPGGGRFYYPRRGFGQISEAYAEAAAAAGAELMLGTSVIGLRPPSADAPVWNIEMRGPDGTAELAADHVWSTLPVTIIPRILRSEVPPEVTAAASSMRFRAMILVYLALDVDRFTEFDAHYFPQSDVRITRLSEPKNYVGEGEPAGRTVLCAELPCDVDDAVWELPTADLGQLVVKDLATAGIPLPVAPAEVAVRKLRQAYPIYLSGYEQPFEALSAWVERLPNFVSFGRQGLFAHDNTHHALAMAYGAADCLEGHRFDTAKWKGYLSEFAKHVVED